ncbi:MAG TPA: response regulator transcription factor [Pyrinomonadaceae bacterium]|nr:response regulator transcription factor [Pyrinomonadaceae bacterium]
MAKRILVVDDEAKLLRAVAVDLRAEGYDVATARSGAEALAHVAQSMPDLIVSDIRMPGMDGYQLARRLRENARTAIIPVIFLTAKDTSADRIEGFRSGVDAYITKPFEPDELLVVIAGILRRVERTHAEIARIVGRPEAADEKSEFIDEDLTEAEARIAGAVARGLSNKEIAQEFRLSVRTVEHHVRHILAKKNFSNRVELALHVREHGTNG